MSTENKPALSINPSVVDNEEDANKMVALLNEAQDIALRNGWPHVILAVASVDPTKYAGICALACDAHENQERMRLLMGSGELGGAIVLSARATNEAIQRFEIMQKFRAATQGVN